MLMRAATVVQVLQTCFNCYCMFYFTCDRSLSSIVSSRVWVRLEPKTCLMAANVVHLLNSGPSVVVSAEEVFYIIVFSVHLCV